MGDTVSKPDDTTTPTTAISDPFQNDAKLVHLIAKTKGGYPPKPIWVVSSHPRPTSTNNDNVDQETLSNTSDNGHDYTLWNPDNPSLKTQKYGSNPKNKNNKDPLLLVGSSTEELRSCPQGKGQWMKDIDSVYLSQYIVPTWKSTKGPALKMDKTGVFQVPMPPIIVTKEIKKKFRKPKKEVVWIEGNKPYNHHLFTQELEHHGMSINDMCTIDMLKECLAMSRDLLKDRKIIPDASQLKPGGVGHIIFEMMILKDECFHFNSRSSGVGTSLNTDPEELTQVNFILALLQKNRFEDIMVQLQQSELKIENTDTGDYLWLR